MLILCRMPAGTLVEQPKRRGRPAGTSLLFGSVEAAVRELLPFAPVHEDWMHRAACRKTDPNIWHPSSSQTVAESSALVAMCEGCPVLRECLTAAVVTSQSGIWAGTSRRFRVKVRRAVGLKPKDAKPMPLPSRRRPYDEYAGLAASEPELAVRT